MWRTFHIHYRAPGQKASAQNVSEKLSALLRVPHRARYVLTLVIGPCNWAWNRGLCDQLERLWVMVPRLRHLLLEMNTSRKSSYKRGGEFGPVLRSLAHYGTHLALDTFKYEGMMRPGSHLYQFLLSQTRIKELRGVDVFSTRMIDFGMDFLPLLRTLVCRDPHIAYSLLSRRPVEILQVKGPMSKVELRALGAASKDCTGSLATLMFAVQAFKDADSKECLEALVHHFPSVQKLALKGLMRPDEEGMHLMHRFTALRDLDCNFVCISMWDAERISEWAAQCSSLERVAVYHPRCVWVRDSGCDQALLLYFLGITLIVCFERSPVTSLWRRTERSVDEIDADWGNVCSFCGPSQY